MRTAGIVLIGVALVAIPAVVALFPYVTAEPRWDRIGWFIAWLAAGLLGAVLATRADARLHGNVEAQRKAAEVVGQRSAIRQRFGSMLSPGSGGLPNGYQFTVYAPSPDGRYLAPLYPAAVTPNDPAIFEAGKGLVGWLWNQRNDRNATWARVVRAPEASDDTYGLTPMQQRRFRDCELVAASVILDADRHTVGVLSALAVRDEGGFGEGENGLIRLSVLGDSLAWLVPTAVEWVLEGSD